MITFIAIATIIITIIILIMQYYKSEHMNVISEMPSKYKILGTGYGTIMSGYDDAFAPYDSYSYSVWSPPDIRGDAMLRISNWKQYDK